MQRLDPLFHDQKEFDEFSERHAQAKVAKKDLSTYEGNCFLGIDAGSTTTKIALVGEDEMCIRDRMYSLWVCFS